ncbi:MAG: 1-deoxy-D-xylulose-5-phosphate reductoisomerase [Bacillota bacterium]|jgi:1-deoxy-D-xylulose-5-phosphate reductoisomerase
MTLRVSILGSTGSIGRQALEVVSRNPGRLEVVGLAAGQNLDLLALQAREHGVRTLCVQDGLGDALASRLGTGVKVWEGDEGICHLASLDEADIILVALVGSRAIPPVMAALEAGKTLALANKECLVAAGHLVMGLAKKTSAEIHPVDSEHSAVYQCLMGQDRGALHRITLTASGGAFRDRSLKDLAGLTPEEALKHPTWRMGPKVTVDSATLMNKGFEVIEARWLFGMPPGGIHVLMHPQSLVHALVEFSDGTTLAHVGPPDMRIPIQYALSHPQRLPGPPSVDLASVGSLVFFQPDTARYPCLRLAYEALEAGGTLPAVMNAANEVAVEAFLGGDLPFLGIQRIIEEVMEGHRIVREPALDDIMMADAWGRREARRLALNLGGGFA